MPRQGPYHAPLEPVKEERIARENLVRENAKHQILGDMYDSWKKGICPWCGKELGREFEWGSHVFEGCGIPPDASTEEDKRNVY